MRDTDTAPEGTDTDTGPAAEAEAVSTGPAAEAEAVSTAERATESREAARYRRQLREAERARDGLQERLTAHQRRDAERVAAQHLEDPADLWLAGAVLDEMLDDEGLLDEAKVQATAVTIVEAKPHYAPRPQPPGFDGGVRTTAAPAPAWGDVIAAARYRT